MREKTRAIMPQIINGSPPHIRQKTRVQTEKPRYSGALGAIGAAAGVGCIEGCVTTTTFCRRTTLSLTYKCTFTLSHTHHTHAAQCLLTVEVLLGAGAP